MSARGENDKGISLPKICCTLNVKEALLAPTVLSCVQEHSSS